MYKIPDLERSYLGGIRVVTVHLRNYSLAFLIYQI